MNSQQQEEAVDLRFTIKSWASETETSLQNRWVACPVCKEEWSKLKPCEFIQWRSGGFGEKDVDHLCVECAETLKKFPNILERYPIDDNADISYQWAGPSHTECQGEKVILERNRIAAISCSGIRFVIRSAPTGILLDIADQPPEYLDNTIAAISRINLALKRFSDSKNTGKY